MSGTFYYEVASSHHHIIYLWSNNTYISKHYFVGLYFRCFDSVYETCNFSRFALFSLSFLSTAGSCLLSLYLSYIVRFFPFVPLRSRFSLLLYYITAYCMCILYIDIFKCILYMSPPSASLASSVDLLQL
jgi:hypothetical protein